MTDVLLGLDSGSELLTTTTRSIPPGVVVVAVRGEVDLVTAPLLTNRLLEHLRHTGPPLVIDLTGVSFFGAAGLTALVIVREAAATVRVRLSVVTHSRRVLRPLAIAELDRELDVHADLTHALVCLGGGADGRRTP